MLLKKIGELINDSQQFIIQKDVKAANKCLAAATELVTQVKGGIHENIQFFQMNAIIKYNQACVFQASNDMEACSEHLALACEALDAVT